MHDVLLGSLFRVYDIPWYPYVVQHHVTVAVAAHDRPVAPENAISSAAEAQSFVVLQWIVIGTLVLLAVNLIWRGKVIGVNRQ